MVSNSSANYCKSRFVAGFSVERHPRKSKGFYRVKALLCAVLTRFVSWRLLLFLLVLDVKAMQDAMEKRGEN
jgi:hypothetical protein